MESGNVNYQVILAEHSSQIKALAKDIKDVAIVVKNVAESQERAIGSIRTSLDNRSKEDKNRTISIIGIIAPIILVIGGVLWNSIITNQKTLAAMQESRITEAYRNGKQEGAVQALENQLNQLNERLMYQERK